jgi:hypothetical protein
MVAVKETDGDAGVGLCLSREQGEILLWVKLDPEAAYLEENIRPRYTFESGRSRCGDLETDARFVYLETSPGKVAYSFIEATRLDYQDKTLFISPQRPMRQDDGVFLRNGAIRWRAWEDEALLDG